MKTKFNLLLSLLVTALLLVGAGCATSQEKQTIALLKQAGFRAMVATTFEKQQKVQSLKPDMISTLKSTNGAVYYAYPLRGDDLLYVGRAKQYSTYQNLLASQKAQAATVKAEGPGGDASWTREVESDESWRDVWSAPSDF